MPDHPDQTAPVSPEELVTLLRLAGLDVATERVPDLLTEFNAHLRLARSLERGGTPSFAPYDPAFPELAPGEGAE